MNQFKQHASKLALLMLTVLMSSLVYTPASFAHKMWDKDKKEKMVQEFYDAVDATPEQRQQLDNLHKEYRTKMEPLEKNMWQKKHDLMVYIAQPNSNQAEAKRMEADIMRTKGQLSDMYIEKAFKSKAVLKPEQQQKAVDYFQKKKEKWKKEASESSSDSSLQESEEQPKLRG